MLVKIQLLPQQTQQKLINLSNETIFVGEVIGSTQTSEITTWIINPKSLVINCFYSLDETETFLAKFISLMLIKKKDTFKLKFELKRFSPDDCDTFDVNSVEEIASFPVV